MRANTVVELSNSRLDLEAALVFCGGLFNSSERARVRCGFCHVRRRLDEDLGRERSTAMACCRFVSPFPNKKKTEKKTQASFETQKRCWRTPSKGYTAASSEARAYTTFRERERKVAAQRSRSEREGTTTPRNHPTRYVTVCFENGGAASRLLAELLRFLRWWRWLRRYSPRGPRREF